MLIVFATSSSATISVQQPAAEMLADVGGEAVAVTRPMRALTIWMPTISGEVSNTVHSRP